MAQHSLSPLVQVIVTPSSVIVHLHMAMTMLQQQAIIPFIIIPQLSIPPAIIVQRFCIMPAAILSSLVQVIFIPPAHFSSFMVHRGTIIMFTPAGIADGPPIMPVPIAAPPIASPGRSIIIALVISIPPHS
jgi:hypothetical protein